MITFEMKQKDGTPITIQFPTAQRPDDRVPYLCMPSSKLDVIRVLLRNKSDERGMRMTAEAATPVGAYNALKEMGYEVDGGQQWGIRPGVL